MVSICDIAKKCILSKIHSYFAFNIFTLLIVNFTPYKKKMHLGQSRQLMIFLNVKSLHIDKHMKVISI